MSSQYTAEPPTEGVVTLHTTHGDLTIGLWPNDAPNATRLFVTHVLAGVFNNTPFHRIVPDLLVQAGASPTAPQLNTKSQPAERNTRLRFRRRGLVALVSDADDEAGAARGNALSLAVATAQSRRPGDRPMVHDQFFITLADAPFLNGKHPIVGTVAGPSVFNLLNVAAHGAVDDLAADDVPRILSAKLDQSPFPDMLTTPPAPNAAQTPAARNAMEVQPGGTRMGKKAPQTPQARAARPGRLLSFRAGGLAGDDDDDADDADDDDDDHHDSNAMVNARFSKRRPLRPAVAAPLTSAGAVISNAKRVEASRAGKATLHRDTGPSSAALKQRDGDIGGGGGGATSSMEVDDENVGGKNSKVISAANAQFEQLRARLQGGGQQRPGGGEGAGAGAGTGGGVAAIGEDAAGSEKMDGVVNTSHASGGVVKSLQKKRQRSRNEGEVLRRLKLFESQLAQRRRHSGVPDGVAGGHGGYTGGGGGDGDGEGSQGKGSVGERDSGDEGSVVEGRGPWFDRGLRLRPPSDDEVEYDVIDSGGTRGGGRGRRRRRAGP